MSDSFSVRRADWERDRESIRRIREAVFVIEQQVPAELEWDGLDADCAHALAHDANGVAIGTGRLLADGHIGSMAVLQPWRSKGVGSSLLTALMEIAAQRGLPDVVLNAQTHAMPFYARHGFVAAGEVFLDAGIPHRTMRRSLAS